MDASSSWRRCGLAWACNPPDFRISSGTGHTKSFCRRLCARRRTCSPCMLVEANILSPLAADAFPTPFRRQKLGCFFLVLQSGRPLAYLTGYLFCFKKQVVSDSSNGFGYRNDMPSTSAKALKSDSNCLAQPSCSSAWTDGARRMPMKRTKIASTSSASDPMIHYWLWSILRKPTKVFSNKFRSQTSGSVEPLNSKL